MFQLFGFSKSAATKKMQNIMKVETALAKVSKSQTELRDVEANYNKMTLKEFESRYPNLPLVKVMNAELRDVEANYNKMTLKEFESRYPNLPLVKVMNAKGIDTKYLQDMVVGQPEFLDGANKLVGSIKPAEYRDVLEWSFIEGSANFLDDKTAAENFDFYGKKKAGRKQNHPLWKRSTGQVERVMGEALGKIYAEKYFPEAAKQRMLTPADSTG